MTDSFTKTTSTSWFGRMGNAIGAILVGVILFFGSFVLLTWNEGRAIQTQKLLSAGASRVVSISPAEVVPANDGKLVHFNGVAEANMTVEDPIFGISSDALKLRRMVEMYQWEESKKSQTKQKLGGGEETTTTYSYAKKWSSLLINSSQFEVPAGHENPSSMAVEAATFNAQGIHVGAFSLPPALVASINNYSPRAVTADEVKSASEIYGMTIHATVGGGIFLGADPATPAIGDLKISFQQAPTGPVSVIARQVGSTLEPFRFGNMGAIELLKVGTWSADVMFAQEQKSNVILTWILRLVGFVMMLVGILLATKVFSVAASVIPFLGRFVGAGVALLAFAVALPLTLATIAVAWLAYRPLIGIPLLVLAGISIFFAGAKLVKRQKKSDAA